MDERAVALVGRDQERVRVEAFLDSPRPAVLVIEGEPGIGKTTLLRHAVEEAERGGWRVLAFRPGEAERSLTFAGLAGLFPDRLLDEVLPRIPEPRRRALEAALLRGDGFPGSAQPATVGLATLSVLTELAKAGPVLLAVDDLQWLDEATGQALEFAFRRAGEADILVVAARRVASDGAQAGGFEEAFPEESRQRIPVGSLSVGAIGRIVSDRLGLSLPRAVAGRLREETAGNPFYAVELARAAQARGSLPRPGEPFPVPGSLVALLRERIAGLSRGGIDGLLAVAALARPTVDLLERALEAGPATKALQELVGADLVRLDGDDLRTTHPLIGSAAYTGMLPARRRALHARLAAVAGDIEERARHLALASTGPDPKVATALDQAASLARRRGASDTAADLAELAVQRTPPGDVPESARRQLVLSQYRLDAGSPASARDAASAAVDLLPAGPGRTEALLLLARIEIAYLGLEQIAGKHFRQAVEEAEGDRTMLLRAHLVAGAESEVSVGSSWDGRADHAGVALELLQGHEDEDPESTAQALVLLVDARFRAGRGLDMDLLDRAASLQPGTKLSVIQGPAGQRAGYLGLAGRHHESKQAVEAALARAEEVGEWGDRPLFLRFLAWLDWWTGDLDAGLERIRQAEEAGFEVGADLGLIWAFGTLILAAKGMFEEARDWCTNAVAAGREVGRRTWEMHGLASTGFLELTLGNRAEAAEALSVAHRLSLKVRIMESGWDRLAGDWIESLILVGRLTEAREAAEALDAEALSSRHPWTRSVAARSLGLLEASEGRFDEALPWFDRSLAADEFQEMRFERARTLLAKGQALRRSGARRAAREALVAAQALFEACGSPPWAGKAATELGALGGRAPRPTEITEVERRVADLAGAGRTNREIAGELFLSVRTVESHLSSVYRKLGVRSRTELATVLLGARPDP